MIRKGINYLINFYNWLIHGTIPEATTAPLDAPPEEVDILRYKPSHTEKDTVRGLLDMLQQVEFSYDADTETIALEHDKQMVLYESIQKDFEEMHLKRDAGAISAEEYEAYETKLYAQRDKVRKLDADHALSEEYKRNAISMKLKELEESQDKFLSEALTQTASRDMLLNRYLQAYLSEVKNTYDIRASIIQIDDRLEYYYSEIKAPYISTILYKYDVQAGVKDYAVSQLEINSFIGSRNKYV